MKNDFLKISNTKLNSRLIVGTGKYKSFKETADAVKASGADMNKPSFAAGSGMVPEAFAFTMLICGPDKSIEEYTACFKENVVSNIRLFRARGVLGPGKIHQDFKKPPKAAKSTTTTPKNTSSSFTENML